MMYFDIDVFLKTYLTVGSFLFIAFILYDLGLSFLQDILYGLCYDLKRKLLYNPSLLVYLLKSERAIDGAIYFIRLKWVTYGTSNNHEERLYKLIQEESLKSLALAITKFLLFSKFSIFTLLITLLYYFRVNQNIILPVIRVDSVLNVSQLINSSLVKGINDFLTLLPSIILVFTIIISSYFVSTKYRYQAAVKQVNKDQLIDLAKVHKELSRYAAILVYEGSKNLNRALHLVHKEPDKFAIKDMLIENRMINICPYIESISEDKVTWREKEHYMHQLNDNDVLPAGFYDIDAIDKIAEILNKAKLEGYYYLLGRFALLNRDMRKILNYKLCSEKWTKQLLFTETGLKNMIAKANKEAILLNELKDERPNDPDIDYYSDLLINEKREFQRWIDDTIVSGVELIVNLSEYVKATDKVFNMNTKKWTDVIGQILGFNK